MAGIQRPYYVLIASPSTFDNGLYLNVMAGVAITKGMVLIWDLSGTYGDAGYVVTTTTTANNGAVAGVAMDDAAIGEPLRMCIAGVIEANAAATVAAADTVATHTVAGQCNDATPTAGAVLGEALTTSSGSKAIIHVKLG